MLMVPTAKSILRTIVVLRLQANERQIVDEIRMKVIPDRFEDLGRNVAVVAIECHAAERRPSAVAV